MMKHKLGKSGLEVAPLAFGLKVRGEMMTLNVTFRKYRLVAALLVLAAAAVPFNGARAADCNKLQGMQFPNTRITLVEQVNPNPVWIYPPSLFTTRAERLGNGPTGVQKPFCRVVGIIEKEINFEVWLPRDWNGKFQGVGNGGLSGAINYPAMGTALRASSGGGAVQNVNLTELGGPIEVTISGIGTLSNPVEIR